MLDSGSCMPDQVWHDSDSDIDADKGLPHSSHFKAFLLTSFIPCHMGAEVMIVNKFDLLALTNICFVRKQGLRIIK